jgi:hypothetical protein
MTDTQTTIPKNWIVDVERFAVRRAEHIGLVWNDLTEAHRDGIRQTVWREMCWND